MLEPFTPFPLKGWVTEGSGEQTGPSSVRSSESVTLVLLKGRVTEGSADQTILQVRSNGVSTTGYSLVVPLKVKGKDLDGVVDTGADGSVINSKFIDITQFEAEKVLLKGLEPDRLIARHLGGRMGGRMYQWDLYVVPIADDFLLGLDFMIAYKVDPLISRNVLMVRGIEVPVTLKSRFSGQSDLEADLKNSNLMSYNNMGFSSDINMLRSCMFQMCLNIYYKLYFLEYSPNMLHKVWH